MINPTRAKVTLRKGAHSYIESFPYDVIMRESPFYLPIPEFIIQDIGGQELERFEAMCTIVAPVVRQVGATS